MHTGNVPVDLSLCPHTCTSALQLKQVLPWKPVTLLHPIVHTVLQESMEVKRSYHF
uniref:Uncharacterized protein n=1 Tax=Anguilla anguilla TaxID=7936 RepID=A0A0E9RIP2_ANGAN